MLRYRKLILIKTKEELFDKFLTIIFITILKIEMMFKKMNYEGHFSIFKNVEIKFDLLEIKRT